MAAAGRAASGSGGGAVTTSVTVNGRRHDVRVTPAETLLETLRARLRLTGAKEACGRGECGACTVLLDGQPRMSCLLLTVLVTGEVTTVEGLGDDGRTLAAEFADCGAHQCGYCTPGQMVHGVALARAGVDDRARLRHALSGNICRCTGYTGIVSAVAGASTGLRRRAEDDA
jgi:aerobic-type carbon monoxide dehydrogenase small subunit (CoxS/CutS family)